MVAFEIFVNGEKRLTIGGEEYSSLHALLGLTRLPLPKPDDATITLAASGVNADQTRVGLWPPSRLKVGDRVEIRVVDVETVDAPGSIQILEKDGDDVDA